MRPEDYKPKYFFEAGSMNPKNGKITKSGALGDYLVKKANKKNITMGSVFRWLGPKKALNNIGRMVKATSNKFTEEQGEALRDYYYHMLMRPSQTEHALTVHVKDGFAAPLPLEEKLK